MRYIDKTKDFLRAAKPGEGTLHDPQGLLTLNERRAVLWLIATVGGDITLPFQEVQQRHQMYSGEENHSKLNM